MANLDITNILEKMTGKDKDYICMATSDLLSELNKEAFKADQDIEPQLTSTVLQQLEDASGDISGLAVKCLVPLVKKVGEDRVLEMTNKLCDKLLNGKDQHRDTASIALKTIIAEVTTTSLAEKILVSLAPQLIKGVNTGEKAEINCECLDILSDLLHRFGNLSKDHECMLTALLSQLGSNQASVRKKSISCIASLAPSLSDDLLAKATLQVVQLLRNRSANSEIIRTNIQMIGSLSRSVGCRFGPHLAETVPLLISYCQNASENDEDIYEYSLQALKSFMLRCPRDISPYCENILNLALKYVSYDPNFTDNMDEDIDEEGQDEDDDDEGANECPDDEDASWKVRRASAKCLSAIIVSHPEMLSKIYLEACPKLIERFREKEENVKMDIFNTFIELLRQTGNVTKGQGDVDKSSPQWLLKQEVPKVVKTINEQLREKSVKTQVGALSVLKELVSVLPDCLADQFGSLVPGIEKALDSIEQGSFALGCHPSKPEQRNSTDAIVTTDEMARKYVNAHFFWTWHGRVIRGQTVLSHIKYHDEGMSLFVSTISAFEAAVRVKGFNVKELSTYKLREQYIRMKKEPSFVGLSKLQKVAEILKNTGAVELNHDDIPTKRFKISDYKMFNTKTPEGFSQALDHLGIHGPLVGVYFETEYQKRNKDSFGILHVADDENEASSSTKTVCITGFGVEDLCSYLQFQKTVKDENEMFGRVLASSVHELVGFVVEEAPVS